MSTVGSISPYTSLIGFVLGFPTLAATYYQAWKTRREAERAREGLVYSQNCVEFLLDDGTLVNVVPLQALHSLPKPEDIVFLPSEDFSIQSATAPGAFRVHRVEHIYTRVEGKAHLPLQARLAKVVAHIRHLQP
jgi:hypothetical protein